MNLGKLDEYRIQHPAAGWGDDQNGMFELPGPCGARLRVIASVGGGWEHVSVSTRKRIPNWTEMEFIKKRTIGDVVAMQLHVPASEHVNVHPNTLHIWRPLEGAIPQPPSWMVG